MKTKTNIPIRKVLTEAAFNRERIGGGKYREVFRVGEHALKFLKTHRTKHYGPITINWPAQPYVKFKFGIGDFNQEELRAYKSFMERVPEQLKENFAHIYWVGRFGERSASLSQLVTDTNGQVSKPITKAGIVYETEFWDKLDELEEALIEQDIPLMDLHPGNILVRRNGQVTPVLFDYKRLGGKTYPFQPKLRTKRGREKRVRGKMNRIRDLYQDN